MKRLYVDEEEGDACVQWSERSTNCLGMRIRRWFGLLIGMLVLIVLFMTLFIVYAQQNADATTCRLTYTDNAVVSEAQMQSWAADVHWPLPVPKYDRAKKACVCSSDDADPTKLALADYVPAWIAPGDLYAMKEDGILSTLPLDMPKTYGPKSHVKVCIRHTDLVALWGDDYLGKHCHLPTVNATGQITNKVKRFFLGYDGALYCEETCGEFCEPLSSWFDFETCHFCCVTDEWHRVECL